MICPKCNVTGSKFCPECGSSLVEGVQAPPGLVPCVACLVAYPPGDMSPMPPRGKLVCGACLDEVKRSAMQPDPPVPVGAGLAHGGGVFPSDDPSNDLGRLTDFEVLGASTRPPPVFFAARHARLQAEAAARQAQADQPKQKE